MKTPGPWSVGQTAPEMLEALQNQVLYMESHGLGPTEHLKNVIKKAKGEA